ncbi:MAG: hypothetical protein LBC17_02090 [Lactobacillaceae bacterium]|jgi:uncharacterized protein YkvS|nr:hypothetical protein [Lactobacillaceae bacterium]
MVAKTKAKLNEELAQYDFWIDDVIVAPPYGNIIHPFTGQVKKIYDLSVLVEITQNDKDDEITVTEMNHRAIVAKAAAEIITKGPKAPEIIDPNANKKKPAKVVKKTSK